MKIIEKIGKNDPELDAWVKDSLRILPRGWPEFEVILYYIQPNKNTRHISKMLMLHDRFYGYSPTRDLHNVSVFCHIGKKEKSYTLYCHKLHGFNASFSFFAMEMVLSYCRYLWHKTDIAEVVLQDRSLSYNQGRILYEKAIIGTMWRSIYVEIQALKIYSKITRHFLEYYIAPS